MVLHQKKKFITTLALLFTIFTLVYPSNGYAFENDDLSVEKAKPSFNESDIVPGKVIVKYKQKQTGSLGLQSLSSNPVSWTTLSFNNEVSVAAKIAELEKDPDIDYVEPVYKVQLISSTSTLTVTDTVYSGTEAYMKQWGKLAAHLDDMGSYTTTSQNEKVTVAVLDTGADLTHPDIKNSIVSGYDFINKDTVAQDDNGHGTHVSGIITAQASSGASIGVAPGVKIMPLKVLNDKGEGDSALLVQAIQFAITNHADIINMSLSVSGNSKALHDVIKQAHNQHILLVSAAGNESNHWINTEQGQMNTPAGDSLRYARYTDYPAAYEEVISVGAIVQLPDKSYSLADFSNVGKVDVVAPGVNIYSTALNGGYIYMSGTSQATPIVTGLSALLKAANKNLDEEDIRTILRTSRNPIAFQPFKLNGTSTSLKNTIYSNNQVSNTMAFGDGLIQGNRAFQVPRLIIKPNLENYPAIKTVTYDLTMVDVHNTVVDATYAVALKAKLYNETSPDRERDQTFDLGAASSGQTQHGLKKLTANFTNNDSVHHVYIYGEWDEQVSGGYSHKPSNSHTLISLPNSPNVSLQSGTYTGKQTVSITSPYQEGMIFLQVQENGKVWVDSSDYRGGKLSVTGDTILTVATLHNNVFSEDAVYQYTIKAAQVGGGGGGGGGGGSSQSPPSLNKEGKMTYDFKPAPIDLLIALNSESKVVSLDASTKEKVDIFTAEFSANFMQKAAERSKTFIIKTNNFTINFPPDSLPVKNGDNAILFKSSMEAAPSIPAFSAASSIYDFSLTENGAKINAFNKPLQVTFSYDKSKVQDTRNLNVYVYDEQQGIWTSVGGTLNGDGTITASLPHFSKYAVLEKKTTLTDIQDHWAQKEIEELSGKQIIDGMDDGSFKPDASMTRAQFVTILTKALKLQSSAGDSNFDDISNDSWYKNAVYAAYQANIVSGLNEHTFSPETNITREQMAVIMVNAYLHATGKKLADIVITQEVNYSDERNISEWARSYVRAATGLGLLSGASEGIFAPKDNSSRAQAAVVMSRLLSKIK
ncbi:S8 family serine peptidase [Paenibacillus sp. HWE-109]|uniref:S8 family peptidase n=1 Tax=Paenibacillus sp. HWE-109 TaxID=1306526 RepID=UPI001EDD5989|nr:S8 family serine peptidase [Paenibacillus sp. HWE-109]UKS25275.1 S8 family serine peptidase [Paenibacillus sp. HWE-109]